MKSGFVSVCLLLAQRVCETVVELFVFVFVGDGVCLLDVSIFSYIFTCQPRDCVCFMLN